jgi:NAD(P)-dependent dehydrogenase (short-subunit alcohol dehydrogenase family)
MLLSNRVAIITGGATGMGRATAVLFAEEGCNVAIADIKMKEANETINMVKEKGREGLAIQCDVSDSSQVKDAVKEVISKFGKVDILVNSAGGGSPRRRGAESSKTPPPPPSITNISDEDWHRGLGLNLSGTFFFCREVVPYMKEKRYGKIVNISSLGWVTPPMPSPPYHASKAGVVGLTNDMVRELSPYNIYANAILPGPIRTPFWDMIVAARTDGTQEAKDAFFKEIGKAVPLGRVGTAEEIAKAVLFLASDLSSYVTGAIIPVAGGLPIMVGRSQDW